MPVEEIFLIINTNSLSKAQGAPDRFRRLKRPRGPHSLPQEINIQNRIESVAQSCRAEILIEHISVGLSALELPRHSAYR